MKEFNGVFYCPSSRASPVEQPSQRIAREWFIATVVGINARSAGSTSVVDGSRREISHVVQWSKLWYHWKFMHCSYGADADAIIADLDAVTTLNPCSHTDRFSPARG